MTATEIADAAAWCLLAWATGYTTGLIFLQVKKFLEHCGFGG